MRTRWRTYVFSGTGCGEKSEWVRVSAFGGVRDGRVSGGPRAGRGVVSNDAPPRAIVFSSGAKDGERREFFLSRRSSRTGHIFFCTSRDRRRASLARILIPRAAVPRGWGERSPAPRRSPRLKKKDDDKKARCGSLAVSQTPRAAVLKKGGADARVLTVQPYIIIWSPLCVNQKISVACILETRRHDF